MSVTRAGRQFKICVLLIFTLALAACGFHLRQNAALPHAMQNVHLTMAGGQFQRNLARALQTSGVNVEDTGGAGVAELNVPVAAFSTDTLTAGGYARITEYSIHYRVQFNVVDPSGHVLIPTQNISMQREYSYDASSTIGNDSQVTQIQRSLEDDMVQAILFRLQAAGKHLSTAPAGATSAS